MAACSSLNMAISRFAVVALFAAACATKTQVPCKWVGDAEASGWDCSAEASDAQTLISRDSASSCLQGKRLVIVSDSIGRYMLMDYLRQRLHCDDSQQQDGELSAVCETALRARTRRGDYDFSLPWSGWDAEDATHAEDSDGRMTVAFRSVTFARNVTSAPWFRDVFMNQASNANSLIIFNMGLWNLKYDQPRSEVPSRYIAEVQQLIATLGDTGASRYLRDRLIWRTTTLIGSNPAFPPGYDADLVHEANGAVSKLWLGAGYRVIDVESMGRVVADEGRGQGQQMLLQGDGTHFQPWLNVLMMDGVLRQACSVGSITMGVQERVSPRMTADPAPSAPAVAANGDKKTTAAAAAAAAAPAASASPPTPAYVLLAASLAIGFSMWWFMISMDSIARTIKVNPVAAGGVFALVWLAVFLIDYVGVLPRVTKERKIGPDMLYGICGLAIFVSLATMERVKERGPGGHGAAPAPPAAAAGSAAAGAVAGSGSARHRPAGGDAADSSEKGSNQAAVIIIDHAASSSSPSSSSSLAGGKEAGDSLILPIDHSAGSGSGTSGESGGHDGKAATLEVVSATASSSSVSVGSSSNSVTPRASAGGADQHDAGGAASQLTAAAGDAQQQASAGGSTAAMASGGGLAGKTNFFSLDLTNELKGTCMVFFLLYHYWDVKLVYNPVRVMVAIFLFLTGYGNAISLQSKGPSMHKFAVAFIRINLLCVVLMSAVQQPWMLYYICPLHTFWTGVVYVFFAVKPSMHQQSRRGLWTKVGILGVVLLVCFELTPLRDLLFAPLWPILQYKTSMYEWSFRCTLDAYAPYAGMVTAFAKPSIVAGLDWLKSGPTARTRVALAAAVLCGILLIHGFALYPLVKASYNGLHRFTAWIPICTYLFIRNLVPALQSRYSRVLAAFGACSLDFYLLQFHIWMGNNAKTVVAPFPDARFLSFVIHTCLFIVLSWCTSQAEAVVLDVVLKQQGKAYALAGIITAALVVCTVAFPG